MLRWVSCKYHEIRSSLPQRFKIEKALHLKKGDFGELHAKKWLRKKGLKFLLADFRSNRGQIDLIFRKRNEEILIFVEVKTRSEVDHLVKPVSLVRKDQRDRICYAAMDYLKLLGRPEVSVRFDIVIVEISEFSVVDTIHVENAFQFPRHKEYYIS